MTDLQKEQIMALRAQNTTYAAISDALDIPIGTLKTFCRRSGLTAKQIQHKPCCKTCGAVLTNNPNTRPRLFCSDHCRQTWWNKHRWERTSAKIVSHTCPTCGKTFADYSGAKRKYCSQECYRGRSIYDGR